MGAVVLKIKLIVFNTIFTKKTIICIIHYKWLSWDL
jgi:hypothetical protein